MRLTYVLLTGALVLASAVGCAAWLAVKATDLKSELASAISLVPELKAAIVAQDPLAASETVDALRIHTAAARSTAGDPLWTLAGAIPWLGPNFQAATEVATAADDVAQLGAAPLVEVFQSLDWETLTPQDGAVDIAAVREAEPKVVSAAHAVKESSNRLDDISVEGLLPQVAEPLNNARSELRGLSAELGIASDASTAIPAMMGADGPKRYLLMIQNNAELRASGGIPGALAVLTFDEGRLSLSEQTSATALGAMAPPVSVDLEQQQIYSGRIGKFMQDVNLTPDFPSAAKAAHSIWEKKTGERLDGVMSMDPVALQHILNATGPVKLTNPEVLALAGPSLPTELSGANVVKTLLSDVYSEIALPELQDVYFAGIASEIFKTFSTSSADPGALLDGVVEATAEGRVLVWSASSAEQKILAKYAVSGSVSGPSVSPAEFGVYFNDGTGAKMDYYVKRTVQLVKECAKDGYEQTTVRITSMNTAPADAATSLPAYVTGNGNYGVPAGSVQTNIVAYGPIQANVETAKVDGAKTEFAPYLHGNRPVGVLAVRLAPGESRTVEFTFGKIVQHTEPELVVTPTAQAVKDVILDTEIAPCQP
ncbi:DUF4012 domain-containing protein [Pseudarthrobacter sp. CCNWLW207]|uniref:DUF4012 domain-containing protein n=1 Tax=Pseudarthrobacter sp. CCNWLW207 TaxID=3127468 RepID=UPI0030780D53